MNMGDFKVPVIVNDSEKVKAELVNRAMWSIFDDSPQRIAFIIGDLEVFYRQKGYDNPKQNFAVWIRFEPHEVEQFLNLLGELKRRAGITSDPALPSMDVGSGKTGTWRLGNQ